jgi:Leucine-rich repeat (LRR) protein
LEVLDLSHNLLNNLPAELGLLVNLQMLFLSHNQLKSVPVAISQLTNLLGIDTSDNG